MVMFFDFHKIWVISRLAEELVVLKKDLQHGVRLMSEFHCNGNVMGGLGKEELEVDHG
jgi:hypothetical protein